MGTARLEIDYGMGFHTWTLYTGPIRPNSPGKYLASGAGGSRAEAETFARAEAARRGYTVADVRVFNGMAGG